MKKLLMTAAALIAFATPALAQKYDLRPDPNYVDKGFPIYNVNGAALLAEYVTTCGVRPTEAAMRDALRFINDIGYAKFLEIASWVHIVRDPDQDKEFCRLAYNVLKKSFASPNSQFYGPIPEELDLSKLTRRLVYCSLKGYGMFATLNKETCKQ